MKRFTYAAVMTVALVLGISAFALAGGPSCDAAAKQAGMKDCCIEAAQAGKGCHGLDAEATKAAYADYQVGLAGKSACDAASAEMNKCCLTALSAGKGCHGLEADELKASYEQKVAHHLASADVKGDMNECCASALASGEGCCGMDAAGLEADYEQKVASQARKVASK